MPALRELLEDLVPSAVGQPLLLASPPGLSEGNTQAGSPEPFAEFLGGRHRLRPHDHLQSDFHAPPHLAMPLSLHLVLHKNIFNKKTLLLCSQRN